MTLLTITDDSEMMLIDETGNSLKVLPPPAKCCPFCATEHAPNYPHNAQSFYYQFLFAAENGRPPTWEDAMEHCSEEMKEAFREHLNKLGVDTNSTNLIGNLKSTEEVKERLNAK